VGQAAISCFGDITTGQISLPDQIQQFKRSKIVEECFRAGLLEFIQLVVIRV
jgi:hypothetical protein